MDLDVTDDLGDWMREAGRLQAELKACQESEVGWMREALRSRVEIARMKESATGNREEYHRLNATAEQLAELAKGYKQAYEHMGRYFAEHGLTTFIVFDRDGVLDVWEARS